MLEEQRKTWEMHALQMEEMIKMIKVVTRAQREP